MSKKRSSKDKKIRLEGKQRDYYTCQICGSTENVEGHHVVDYSFGGASDPDNIITLCHDCHRKVHDGLVDIDIF